MANIERGNAMGLIKFLTGGKFVIGELQQPKQVKMTCSKCGRTQYIGGNERREICDKCAKKLRRGK